MMYTHVLSNGRRGALSPLDVFVSEICLQRPWDGRK